ncbi:MAG: DUF2200 domain-containing protein [Planctomycetota bacterium]
MNTREKVYSMRLGDMYPFLLAKVEKKGRTQAELDQAIRWLTGYTQRQLTARLKNDTTYGAFFADAPEPNPNRKLITGVICGERVEAIDDPAWQEVRYLDKLVDELAKGKAMDRVLRHATTP